MASVCGADCGKCVMNGRCCGCTESGCRPFGERCMVADYCMKGHNALENLKEKILSRINSLGIENFPKVTDIFPLNGAFVNLELPLPNGEKARFWNDNKIYLGGQVQKLNSERCFGFASDGENFTICEYSENGLNPELIMFGKL